jgi:hypothetical protein
MEEKMAFVNKNTISSTCYLDLLRPGARISIKKNFLPIGKLILRKKDIIFTFNTSHDWCKIEKFMILFLKDGYYWGYELL